MPPHPNRMFRTKHHQLGHGIARRKALPQAQDTEPSPHHTPHTTLADGNTSQAHTSAARTIPDSSATRHPSPPALRKPLTPLPHPLSRPAQLLHPPLPPSSPPQRGTPLISTSSKLRDNPTRPPPSPSPSPPPRPLLSLPHGDDGSAPGDTAVERERGAAGTLLHSTGAKSTRTRRAMSWSEGVVSSCLCSCVLVQLLMQVRRQDVRLPMGYGWRWRCVVGLQEEER